jgi:hypothetical protein
MAWVNAASSSDLGTACSSSKRLSVASSAVALAARSQQGEQAPAHDGRRQRVRLATQLYEPGVVGSHREHDRAQGLEDGHQLVGRQPPQRRLQLEQQHSVPKRGQVVADALERDAPLFVDAGWSLGSAAAQQLAFELDEPLDSFETFGAALLGLAQRRCSRQPFREAGACIGRSQQQGVLGGAQGLPT